MSEHCAVPLCLPNNCKWDEQTGEYSKDEDQDRNSLYVLNAALERLRTIEGTEQGYMHNSCLFRFMRPASSFAKQELNFSHKTTAGIDILTIRYNVPSTTLRRPEKGVFVHGVFLEWLASCIQSCIKHFL